jgi:dTDP-4-amino-4,6-dideoxygalactose transaminase
MSEIIVPFGNLKENYLSQKQAIDEAISAVLQSGWFILGEKVAEFERAFADYCDTAFGIGVGSGTEALHLALIALGVGAGDEVITVANTCVPTVSAITFAGAYPVLVDIDPQTYTMDPAQIEERITKKTKVILPVHLYGQCADMDPILEIAARHGIKVVEDCAQAHGSMYKSRMAGSMGDAGAYSFYPSKNLGAFGDAGMVITNDAMTAEKVRKLRNYGESQRYYHDIKGFNSRLDEMQAAILLAKLQRLDSDNERRRDIAGLYSAALASIPEICLPIEGKGRRHAYHLYVIQVPRRSDFQEYLAINGIQTLIHYPVPIHRQIAYSECFKDSSFLVVTERLSDLIVSLPIYPELTDDQVSHVIRTIERWADRFR